MSDNKPVTSNGRHVDWTPFRFLRDGYSAHKLRGDARAGLNVALLAFPQGMAYAAIAGLPIQYGIFGSVLAGLITPIWAGSRFIVAGPTNATSVMLLAGLLGLGLSSDEARVAVLPIVIALSGLFLVFGSILRVAALVQYVSRSVVAGYITAAAFYIILNQLRKVFGFNYEKPEGATVFDDLILTISNIGHTHFPTLLLSLIAAGFYYILNRKFKTLPNVAITLVVVSGLGYFINQYAIANDLGAIATLSAINLSEWQFTLPPFERGLIIDVSLLALIIAFLSTLEGTSIGKELAAKAGSRINVNQEMLGIGLANMACAFGQGMPASGSLTRSQLSYDSGSTTGMASIFASCFLLLTAFFFGGFTQYIPVSVLGVVVISIGLSLINFHVLRVVWYATKGERTVFIITFAAALLLRLDFSIIVGVAVSILLFIQKAAQPVVTEYNAAGNPKEPDGEEEEAAVSIVHVEGDLFFGAAEIFRDQMRDACARKNLKIVILKIRNARCLDATSILALEELVLSLRQTGRFFLISEVRPKEMKIFENSGFLKIAGQENIFADDTSNPTLSTSKAIRRAMKLLEGKDANVKIFLGGSAKRSEDSD
jgi:SulP family sulfate permease|tara:strand:- start:91058 stop:92851 length:1794 start_codon:yes stop_codon:yes gene_type:complete